MVQLAVKAESEGIWRIEPPDLVGLEQVFHTAGRFENQFSPGPDSHDHALAWTGGVEQGYLMTGEHAALAHGVEHFTNVTPDLLLSQGEAADDSAGPETEAGLTLEPMANSSPAEPTATGATSPTAHTPMTLCLASLFAPYTETWLCTDGTHTHAHTLVAGVAARTPLARPCACMRAPRAHHSE